MSSTNRGSVREVSDFYPTPYPVITNLLLHHQLQPGHLLECCAGSGNLNYAIRERSPDIPITSVEIRPEEKHELMKYGDTYITDYLQWKPDKKYKTIITIIHSKVKTILLSILRHISVYDILKKPHCSLGILCA